jgi:hypothetical protein
LKITAQHCAAIFDFFEVKMSSSEIDEEHDFDHLLVVLNEFEFSQLRVALQESQWIESDVRGISYRIDPARPEMKQNRHIHIAPTNKLNAKNQQVAWNDNGTRHDKKTFNRELGSRRAIKDLAHRTLGLPAEIVLEYISANATGGRALLNEAHEVANDCEVLASTGTQILAATRGLLNG